MIKGNPLDGYAFLRDLKDRAILLAGLAHNITIFMSFFGYAGVQTHHDKQVKKLKNKRRKEEKRIFNKIIRKDSGLSSEIIKELSKWEQLFQEQVHGGKFTFFSELGEWVGGKSVITIGPAPKKDFMAMYMNRVC